MSESANAGIIGSSFKFPVKVGDEESIVDGSAV
jgi:hypothetical protein